MTRVALADDHSVLVEGLRHILQARGGEIVGTADSGPALVQLAIERSPDIVILDYYLRGLDGTEAVGQLRHKLSNTKFIFFTRFADPACVRDAFRAGAHGYVLKTDPIAAIQQAWDDVREGRYYVSPSLHPLSTTGVEPPDFGGRSKDLTPRQREVLRLVAEGKTAKEIAVALGLSVKTVEFHKRSIMDARQLRTVAQLTRYAAALGLVDKP